jgi:hypothetical protein
VKLRVTKIGASHDVTLKHAALNVEAIAGGLNILLVRAVIRPSKARLDTQRSKQELGVGQKRSLTKMQVVGVALGRIERGLVPI